MRSRTALLATVGLIGASLMAMKVASAAPTSTRGDLAKQLAAIENQPRYRQADWGYTVLDASSGSRLISQNDVKLFDPGSTMKTYAVSAALDAYGPNYRFHTPVYRDGSVVGGDLNGNLVLVASGDPSLGLREQKNGTVYYESLPKLNQSYANIGLPGPVEPPGNPLSGLDQLAKQVRASGVTHVGGNVLIDDRLFNVFDGFPDGLISPIWVNENLIDVLVTPGAVNHLASINWRPMTATYTVTNEVMTVATGGSVRPLQIGQPSPGHLVVTGEIAKGTVPTLVVHEIDNPSSFARTAFIEALQRAGVSVAATPTGSNPENLLPARGSYKPAAKLAEHVSAVLGQFSNLILQVSWNRGADLMTCLAAVSEGSNDCEQGLVAEVKLAERLGVSSSSIFPFDGAGSNDQDRTSPSALATFDRRALSTPFGKTLFDSLPVLGRTGTLATVLTNSPAAGHARIKTGNRVVGTAAGQIIVLGNSLAGYIQAKSGRLLTVMIATGNVPISAPAEFEHVTLDQAVMVQDIQQAF
jgi:D-alanyl-D-alanine carboxypeptidase/D-alanyl-D-alanine-endopeptidase (penicillin-binding protein 4)